MAIAKNPRRPADKPKVDKIAEEFIAAAGESLPRPTREKLIQTPVRFSPALLKRIDAAAKKRGLGRTSWIRYAASRVLDEDEAN
jgi:hypothetical protein